MQRVYFQMDTSSPVRVHTKNGKIDFSLLSEEFGFDAVTIKLNGDKVAREGLLSAEPWAEIQKLFQEESEADGTEDKPVLVAGRAPVHPMPTGMFPART